MWQSLLFLKNSHKDNKCGWATAIKRPQFFLKSAHTARKTCAQRERDVEQTHTKHSPLSHFPDNAVVGALAIMCHSSAGSSGMCRDRLYLCCPCQQLSTSISITCSVWGNWGGRAGWGEKDRVGKAQGAKKTQCSIRCLAVTQVHDGGSAQIQLSCPIVCSRVIERTIRPSDNHLTDDVSLSCYKITSILRNTCEVSNKSLWVPNIFLVDETS